MPDHDLGETDDHAHFGHSPGPDPSGSARRRIDRRARFVTAQLPRRGPVPPVREMTNAELVALVTAEHPYRGRAVFELNDRVAADDDAATRAGELSLLPSVRATRLFDRVSLAWSTIIALLAAETPHARATAYGAFRALGVDEQRDLLDYLECDRIEDAHPRTD